MANLANVKIKPVNATWNDEDLGYLDGDVEIKLSESLADVTTHQTGDQPVSNVRKGVSAEVTLSMKESDVVRLVKFVKVAGDSLTPSAGTAVAGWGTSKIGTSTFADAKRLVLHGVNAGATKTEDWTFWKAYPVLESIKFSGSDFQTIPVTFKIYNDDTKDSKISLFGIGDSTQTEFDEA